MATVTKSIGATGRDYSTITLWEADLDDAAIYSASDDAVGECYNDGDLAAITINGGGTIGLTSIRLTSPIGERHDGTANSGVRILSTTSTSVPSGMTVPVTFEFLEYDANSSRYGGLTTNNSTVQTLYKNLIVHNVYGNTGYAISSGSNERNFVVVGCFVYDVIGNNAGGIAARGINPPGAGTFHVRNCTIYGVENTTGGSSRDAAGIYSFDLAGEVLTNNLVMGTVTGSGTASDYWQTSPTNQVQTYCASEDTTSSGTGSLENLTPGDELVSTVGGSEDLHLKEGSGCIGVGTDLVDTPTGVKTDINGANRDSGSTVWDIGAHQYEQLHTIGATARDYSTMTLWEADLDDTSIYGGGSRAKGECYNDSVFDEAVSINGGGTVGLNFVTLTVASGERHDGTAGTGARDVRTSGDGNNKGTITTGVAEVRLEWLEVDNAGYGQSRGVLFSSASTTLKSMANNLIVHGVHGQYGVTNPKGIGISAEVVDVTNCLVYAIDTSDSGTGGGCLGIGTTNNEAVTIHNCTIHSVVGDGSANSYGVRLNNENGHKCRNSIVTDTGANGSGSPFDFTLGSGTGDKDYNASSDTTATGTGSITSITTADQFVSTVGGSEDLHLKAGSDCIGVGTDLVDTPTGVKTDINGANRDALAATVWDIGAHQYEQVASIGATARDYSTITLWEADLDDATIYGGGSRVKGECYNDSTFDEAITINGGGTIGLTSITLTVPTAERHDGTEGTGVRIVATGSSKNLVYTTALTATLEWFEFDCNGYAPNDNILYINANTTSFIYCRNLILHGAADGGFVRGMFINNGGAQVLNCFIYDITCSNSGGQQAYGVHESTAKTTSIRNCTVYGVTNNNGSGSVQGITSGFITSQNNLSLATGGTTSGSKQDFGGGTSYNASSDSTATGTGSLTLLTASDQLVSTVGGSEDLHLKEGSSCIGAGTDLVDTPTGVKTDINGANRDALAATVWDIGAHQYEQVASIGATARDYSTMALWEADLGDTSIYGGGSRAKGECYNDADFTGFVKIDATDIGLAFITLTAASGERHDGTAGTGCRILGNWIDVHPPTSTYSVEISWIEIDRNSRGSSQCIELNRNVIGVPHVVHACILHGYGKIGISNGTYTRGCSITNNFIYDGERTTHDSIGINLSAVTTYDDYWLDNNTIFNINAPNESTGDAFGIKGLDRADHYLRNNVVCDVVGAISSQCFQGHASTTEDHNVSSDSTAQGTGSITDVTTADQFVSTVGSSEDLHLKTGSDCINAGTDLGTTSPGVNIDINGRDRDAEADTWDIGAHEFIAAGGGPEDFILQRHRSHYRTNTLALR